MTTNTAPIKWAQRADSLYITIALPGKLDTFRALFCESILQDCTRLTRYLAVYADVKDETINLSDKELHFKGTSEGKEYQVNIEFFKPVDSKDSTYKVLPRSVQMHVLKAAKGEDDDDDEEFWPRLLKDKALEKNQVAIDWNRWADEDDDEEGFDMSALEGGSGMGGMPGMGGMGGMGGMPGMEGMGGMGGMGGMPGMEGMGGMDMEALVSHSLRSTSRSACG